VRVYAKPKWDAKWQPAHFLWPIDATIGVAPTVGVAHFEWLVGNVKDADSNLYRFRPDTPLRDTWVRIEVLPDNSGTRDTYQPSDLWIGRICEDNLDAQGVADTDNGTVQRGRKVVTAYDLAHELDRCPVRNAFVTNDGAAGFYVDRPLVFNELYQGPSGLNRVGNRSEQRIPHPDDPTRKAYAFAGEKGHTGVWTAADIVEYLLAFYGPAGVPVSLAGDVDALNQLVYPRVNLDDYTVLQSLNRLIDRRRGLGWCLRHSTDGAGETRFAVHVYSVLDEPITFDDAKVAANAETVRLDLTDAGHLVEAQGLQLDTLGRYSRVVVSGRPVLACFTVSIEDSTLEKGWTSDEAAAYRAGVGTDKEKNDQARKVDKFAHVFTHFHVPAGFNWRVNDYGTGAVNANPVVDEAGRIKPVDTPQAPVRSWGHRFERFLPIVKTQEKPDANPEYLEPFVILKDAGGNWIFAHNAPGEAGGGASIRMLDTHFGLEMRFTPNHLVAEGVDWTGAAPTKTDPKYKYSTMRATVATRLDSRLRVVVDLDRGDDTDDRVLHLEVNDAELHYLVPGTITGVSPSGVLQFSTVADSIVRDDGPRLRRIAALAKAWYRKERSSLTLTVRDLWLQYRPGMLVLAVTDKARNRPVNTPVSQVTYDLREMTTTLRTNWAELDVGLGRRR
jgi:hypothetical protein